nr:MULTISPECIES: tyrosine-type recombinase/integrase [unclassified Lactonifactor]
MEAILKIPNITIPDMGVIMELQKNTKSGKLLNKAIRRIIRDCNDEQFLKTENPEVLLPHFSCHSLRHTFTTRMCEAGVNIKVIQDTLGHKDITTTLNIYTDVTKELKKTEFEGLDKYFDNSIA